jgi:hypothetical protein
VETNLEAVFKSGTLLLAGNLRFAISCFPLPEVYALRIDKLSIAR